MHLTRFSLLRVGRLKFLWLTVYGTCRLKSRGLTHLFICIALHLIFQQTYTVSPCHLISKSRDSDVYDDDDDDDDIGPHHHYHHRHHF